MSVSTHIFVYHEFREDFLSIVKNSGVNSIEIFSSIPHFPYTDRKFIEKFIISCEKKGVRIESVHFPLYFHIRDIEKNKWTSLSSEDEALRLASVQETLRSAEILNILERGILIVHPTFPKKDVSTKRLVLFKDSMDRILDGLAENVKVAIENTTLPSGLSGKVAELAESFPGGKVGICIDVGHANVAEDPAEAIANAGGKLINVHLSDNGGHEDEHLPPGDGTVDWNGVFASLRTARYRGLLTLELRDPKRGTSWAPHAFTSLIERGMAAVAREMKGIHSE